MGKRKHVECQGCGGRYDICTPDEICAYLESTGWIRREAKRNDRWAYYDRPDATVGVRTVEVPLMRGASDWPLRYRECLVDIRIAEKRPLAEITRDMLPAQERIEHAENEMLRWGQAADTATEAAKVRQG